MNEPEVEVWKIDKAMLNDRMFWVYYNLFRSDGKSRWVDYSGSRMVLAVDELALFTEFPKQMQERHGTNNVRWRTGDGRSLTDD